MNDVIVVEVENKIPDQDVSIHWHGIEQKGTPYMDGVPMVTQCPINYGGKYKYAFIASSPGTFFYHAHSGKLIITVRLFQLNTQKHCEKIYTKITLKPTTMVNIRISPSKVCAMTYENLETNLSSLSTC